ncbi:Trp biosynthesis-associated membrane protein [Microbacterium sp. YY-01]|uniref:Trp biosynthesis-associated membrane protein n=1 Tax=Microbacterium sp. YY-01 TaxID=3421634 RepID=UPI003D177B47
MTRYSQRGRSLTASGFVIAGGLSLIAGTQTWLTVARTDSPETIDVIGSQALALLVPLSLAALALGAAIALVGIVLRRVFAVVGVAIGAAIAVATLTVIVAQPLSSLAPAMTEVTGLAGDATLEALIATVTVSVWPWIAAIGGLLLAVTGAFAFMTAPSWSSAGRRFESAATAHEGPVDAVDSWDDLSHGTDPTG